jgi:multicomponent Na+:H+ antiporter subunit D
LFASLFSIHYFEHENVKLLKRYQAFSLLNYWTILLIFLATNFFTFFIFFELLLIASYVLIIHYQTKETFAAGIKYFFFQIIGGLFLFFGLVLTFSIIKTSDFIPGGYAALSTHPLFSLIFWCYIIGLSIKAGLFPLHIWLPEAHPVAPSPASALLSGMVIKTGSFGIFKVIVMLFGTNHLVGKVDVTILVVLSVFTMFWGSAVAIGQFHLKRVLAYSSVSQIGYILMGVSLLSPISILGSLIHTAGHAFVKSTLFLSAGSMIENTKQTDITKYNGYGQRNPLVFSAFTIGALSMIGFPLFANFITKWVLGMGIMEAFQLHFIPTWLMGLCLSMLMISSLLNALYYTPILIRGWFYPLDENDKKPFHISWSEAIPLCLLSIIIIALFFFPHGWINPFIKAISPTIPVETIISPF